MIQQAEPDLLKKGREGKTNQKILELISQKPLTAYQISKTLGKAYSTIFDRIDDLKTLGIIQEKGKTKAAKTHNEIPLWGLTSYGFYLSATQSLNSQIRESALEECRRRLLASWNVYWELYDLDSVKDPITSRRLVTKSITSDEGIVDILRAFGPTPLDGEASALFVFRRMLDIGMILVESEDDFALPKLGGFQLSANFAHMLTNLADIALDHPRLRKLYEVIREVDGPLYRRIKSEAIKQTVVRLSKSVPLPVARKLAMTSFLRGSSAFMDVLDNNIVESSLDQVVESAVDSVRRATGQARFGVVTMKDGKELTFRQKMDISRPNIQNIVLEKERLSIVTNDPSVIRREWLRHSDAVYSIDDKGQVRTLKGAKLVKRS